MEKLEEQIQQKEAAFISIVEGIIKQSASSRAKIAMINKQYIKCLVAIDDLISQAKLQTPPAVEASSTSA